MLVAILAMWVSTVVYWISTLVYAAKTNNGLQVINQQNDAVVAKFADCAAAVTIPSSDLTVCQDAYYYIELNPFILPPSYIETEVARTTRACIGSAVLIVNVCTAPLNQFNSPSSNMYTWLR